MLDQGGVSGIATCAHESLAAFSSTSHSLPVTVRGRGISCVSSNWSHFLAVHRNFADKSTREAIFRKYDENGTGSLNRYMFDQMPSADNKQSQFAARVRHKIFTLLLATSQAHRSTKPLVPQGSDLRYTLCRRRKPLKLLAVRGRSDGTQLDYTTEEQYISAHSHRFTNADIAAIIPPPFSCHVPGSPR